MVKKVLNNLNVAKTICDHVIGKKHSARHQMIVGSCVMIFGVSLVKITASYPSFLVHLIGDVLGYFIHGIGAIPFFKNLEKE